MNSKLMLAILPIFVVANGIDLVSTLYLRQYGALDELNPVADSILLRMGPIGLVVFKVIVVGFAAVVLWVVRSRFALFALIVCTIISCVVAGIGLLAVSYLL